ncbi:MAG: UDP-glucose 6-dehydrogenase 1 [Trizodia sp. TS-e1964]|nr:MAG: UDP-glucose 6-dehydrogenase 1 [Trizodia sp. TS-e1964]
MTLLEVHLEQISLSADAISDLPFHPPKIFTNALLHQHDITALIRDTESHERALFSVPTAPLPQIANDPSAQHHKHLHGNPSNSASFDPSDSVDKGGRTSKKMRAPRRNTAVAAVLGGNMFEQMRIAGSGGVASGVGYGYLGGGRDKGDIDVELLLQGAEKLCEVYPIRGANDKISALRARYQRLISSIAHYETRVSEQALLLERLNGPQEIESDIEAEGKDDQARYNPTSSDKQTSSLEERAELAEEYLLKEEAEIRELEKKKQNLEDRKLSKGPNKISHYYKINFELVIRGLALRSSKMLQGGSTCSVIAAKSENINVTVVDLDPVQIAAWNSSSLPVSEPGLYELVSIARDGRMASANDSGLSEERVSINMSDLSPPQTVEQGYSSLNLLKSQAYRRVNLFFTTDIDRAILEADLIFVSVNTPTKKYGIGSESAADLANLEGAIRNIAKVATADKIIVEKSTVPCGTAHSMRKILEANARPGVRFELLSNPEFLAEGTAVNDLLHPGRILIGSLSTNTGYKAAASLKDIYAAWVPRDRIVCINLWSSELAKLAANAMLAQRISSMNALSAICEVTGARVDEVSLAVGLDTRLGPHMLNAGLGFGGSCFEKDILSLIYLSQSFQLHEVAEYWRQIIAINEYQKQRFVKRILFCLHGNLSNKKLAIFGFAYKKNTNDTRGSLAIPIISKLIAEKANVCIYDPKVKEHQIWKDLQESYGKAAMLAGSITVSNCPYEACKDAHAVIIITDWDEFSNKPLDATPLSFSSARSFYDTNTNLKQQYRINWARVASVMKIPMFIFDGRNFMDVEGLESLGFSVETIGRASKGN